MAYRVLAKWPLPGACPLPLTCRVWSLSVKETIPTWLSCPKTVQDGQTSRINTIQRGQSPCAAASALLSITLTKTSLCVKWIEGQIVSCRVFFVSVCVSCTSDASVSHTDCRAEQLILREACVQREREMLIKVSVACECLELMRTLQSLCVTVSLSHPD